MTPASQFTDVFDRDKIQKYKGTEGHACPIFIFKMVVC